MLNGVSMKPSQPRLMRKTAPELVQLLDKASGMERMPIGTERRYRGSLCSTSTTGSRCDLGISDLADGQLALTRRSFQK